MSDPQATYEQLCEHLRQTALLGGISSLLNWDERTMLPPKAGAYRAEELTLLAGMLHERVTDPRLGDWLEELADTPLAADPHSDSGTTIRQTRRTFEKKTKLPKKLVEELTRTSVLGQQVWQEARQRNDFASFRPLLEKTFELKREEAEALGYPECRYDALLDDYEPQALTSQVRAALEGLRDQLVPLVAELADSGHKPDDSFLKRSYPVAAQAAFGRAVAEAIGFDFEAGRLDVTAHPFCSGIGPGDCRITTRYHENNPTESLFGTMHEAGHGIYEQGLRLDQWGLPLGVTVSLGIHESQSRLWENLVGRSRAFWEYFYGQAQATFEALSDISLDRFYAAINQVRPSLIRIEADEATYNLHILIRFELEQALLNEELAVADLPGAWNEKYRSYLGIEPPTDADGVMQDIHWSAGLVGYFPTYSLGNLYASQFFAQADKELGGLEAQFAKGQFTPLRDWLREKIHQHGERYTSTEFAERITGAPVSHDALMTHLRAKFGALYGLD